MEHDLATYRRRDGWERELDMAKNTAKSAEQYAVKATKAFEKKLKEYQVWKEENKINGINY